ncbi:MGDG synthase family glycosyltransferase [Indiicoccus explosivorum]|uniref:MGDG synthase family glycosyltransferase n=1 Tax=Indiicoccus explosivorum TaxID=1917864 RepID=UPI000B453F82|nr:glycosyltransferase [Indiicoccus explosivorum]
MAYKVLILPIFQMPSGHHKAADTVADLLHRTFPAIDCHKKDFITYCGKRLETVVSKSYIKWIKHFPASYQYVYSQSMQKPKKEPDKGAFMKRVEEYFDRKMEEMIAEESPDLIICTHSFPSGILDRLKRKGTLLTPVLNVYTDFFISSFWGKQHIDYHFAPNPECKRQLTEKYGIAPERVFVTGIPVHPLFTKKTEREKGRAKRLLVAGGNTGLGNMEEFISKINGQLALTVLCGTNMKLYRQLKEKNFPNTEIHSYIDSQKKMNRMYDRSDAILTKPGGITVSEALAKRLPVFTVRALPGQEYENLEYLEEKGLIIRLDEDEMAGAQLVSILNDEVAVTKLKERIEHYLGEFEMPVSEALKQVFRDHFKTGPLQEDLKRKGG